MTTPDAFPGRAYFEAAQNGEAPWDIGAAQQDLMDLIDAFPPVGRVVDLGCGTGDLVIALADRGYDVLGVDFDEAAIEEARWRLQVEPPELRARVELRVGDALHPSAFATDFDSAVDSGFYHLFDAETRGHLALDLSRALPAGGRYYMIGFAIAIPAPDAPKQITAGELERCFSNDEGWSILELRPAVFRTRGYGNIPSVAFCAERKAP